MRTITSIILIIIFGFLAQSYLPWWTIAIVCFVIGIAVNRSWWSAVLSGFFGVGLLWLGMIFYQTAGNGGILVERMSGAMEMSSTLLYTITLAIGVSIGMLSTLTGYSLKHTEKKKRTNKYHV